MKPRWRWRIAYALGRLPWTCWTDLVLWANNGMGRLPLFGDSAKSCREEKRTHRDHACYCGKFRCDEEDGDA